MNLPATYYERLVNDAHIVELRHFHGRRIESGLFDSADALMAAIEDRSRDGTVYATLNRPTARRVPNAFGTPALRDCDIQVIGRLVFDFDPDRPKGVPSSAVELSKAIAARDRLVRMLSAADWPMPALACSGNGAHAIYRICVAHDPQWTAASRIIYRGLADRLGDLDGVTFDTVVRNASRIWRCYGTRNAKGTATPDRPHRLASVTLPTGAWQVVPVRAIERLAATLQTHRPSARPPARPTPIHRGTGDYRSLDVAQWFRSHDHYRRSLGDGKHAVVCPWAHEHSTDDPPTSTATVVWESTAERWPTFHCAHAHCDRRTIRDVLLLWRDADAHCAASWQGGRAHG